MPKEPKPARSPVGPTPPLPASVEQSYRQKCIELKKRINEIETSNDVLVVRIQRARRGIQRMRLERAFLLQQLEQRTEARVEDSVGSPSPPPTPKEKPLRMKRPRKALPAPAESPMPQGSPSPSNGLEPFPFAPGFTSVNLDSMNSPGPSVLGGSGIPLITPKTGKGSRNKGGPKRPPNAYMIFCEKERDAVRARESSKEGFDMHKALAQAWRDLKAEGQRPYFQEYETNREKYLQKVSDLKSEVEKANTFSIIPKRGTRAPSAGSSVVPGSNYEAGMGSPTAGSGDEGEAEEAGGFTAVNR